jgi:hypothetical protein
MTSVLTMLVEGVREVFLESGVMPCGQEFQKEI